MTLPSIRKQRPKNLGSRVALLPGKFLRIRKVFARITEKYLVNCPNTFKTTQIFPDDCQFSGLFQNCPDFSRWQPIFRIISKLSGFFQMTANFPDDFKTVRMFQVTANFPDDFKTVQIFPDDCQFSRWFQNCPDFPDDCRFWMLEAAVTGTVPDVEPPNTLEQEVALRPMCAQLKVGLPKWIKHF